MSKIAPAARKTDAALQRLENAIARLDSALSGSAAAAPMPLDLFGADVLTGVRRDYAKLDQASRQVEARLDAMADRLQLLLES